MAHVSIQDGHSCLLWDDLWDNRVPLHMYLELYSFAKSTFIYVRVAIEASGPHILFHLPFSQIAFQQLETLAHSLNNMHISQDSDIWTYIWGGLPSSPRQRPINT